MRGVFEEQLSGSGLDGETLSEAGGRVSLQDRPSDEFFNGFDHSGGLEGLDDPATPLQELGVFVSGLFKRENLPWLAIRAIPIALILIAGLLFWPSSSDDPNAELSIRTAGVATPQVELAEIAPGLSYTARNPELLVQLGADGIPNSGDEPGAMADAEDALDDADAEDPATPDDDDPLEEQATATTEANASTDPTDQTTTTEASQTTTTEAESTATTGQATTTEPPSTEAPATTTPPTTAAATTEPPTTPAPTTAPPTTPPPTTAPPTTQPPANNCGGGGEFERIYREDFNGSVGGEWGQYNGPGNAGYGLRRPSAISTQDGKLVITARNENGTLVSGGMSHNISQTYGKYVVRVRTDNDPSQAVSGVVLTWPTSGQHPRDGENNIYETLVQTPNRNPFFTFIHKPFGSHSDQEYKEHHADGAQFQTMTMEWTPDRITIIREGPGSNGNYDAWTVNETGADLIPDVNHHLTLQLDGWKHSIGGDVRMEVDFVEVHKYCG